MDLKDWITRRKSCRSYTSERVDEKTIEQIRSFMGQLQPLYPDVPVQANIVTRDAVKCICPWTTPQLIAIYSEKKEGYLENVGFLFQQLDLYLQSIGLGSCWLGMGRMDSRISAPPQDGMQFVILLAFGSPKGFTPRSGKGEFKRRSPSQIADRADEQLEPARLAPSSVNSQPWYFVHDGDSIHVYCAQRGLLGKTSLSDMNRIDIGIALAHLYVANPETFRFFQTNNPPAHKAHHYIGSFSL